MDLLTLEGEVELKGHDFLGRPTQLTLSPSEGLGWVWEVMGVDVPITPALMHSRARRITLVHKGFELNEFEHIGILRAAGLHHVRLRTDTQFGWPPYDGGSFALWQKVIPQVRLEKQKLRPYRIDARAEATLASDPSRHVAYWGDGNDASILRMTGLVEFPSLRKEPYRFSFAYGEDSLVDLARSRTLGWPPWLYYVSCAARMLGWPHHARICWPQKMHPADVLDEIGRHRLMDAVAILNFLAPAGTYLCGGFHSCKGNHALDLMLMRQLADKKVVAFPAVA